jgi:hypothetical protein
LNCIGAVKPRSAAEDWLAIGFDPWSAGKDPLQSGELPQRPTNPTYETPSHLKADLWICVSMIFCLA